MLKNIFIKGKKVKPAPKKQTATKQTVNCMIPRVIYWRTPPAAYIHKFLCNYFAQDVGGYRASPSYIIQEL